MIPCAERGERARDRAGRDSRAERKTARGLRRRRAVWRRECERPMRQGFAGLRVQEARSIRRARPSAANRSA